jgi:LuxR family maltose regulon positive regulatory protein
MLILKALLLNASNQRDLAADTIAHALKHAEPEGFFRIFIDKGDDLAPLVRTASQRNGSTEHTRRLIAAFEKRESATASTPSRASLIEQLSVRELEVLRLLADGASNREIADQLVVSLGTVKKHLNNIFLKLDAHNRTQAVAAARNYNLI